MNKISSSLAVSLMIVCGVIGIGVGYWLTPEYQSSMYDKTPMDLGKPDRFLDLRYIDAMIAHHRGAMLLADQARVQSNRQEIKDLSAMILAEEPAAIAELYAWKKAWYNDTRTVKDPEVVNLGTYDELFDLRFLNALIAHHDEGLEMTREVSVKSSRAEILNNADAVDTFLKTTRVVLTGWRTEWYNK